MDLGSSSSRLSHMRTSPSLPHVTMYLQGHKVLTDDFYDLQKYNSGLSKYRTNRRYEQRSPAPGFIHHPQQIICSYQKVSQRDIFGTKKSTADCEISQIGIDKWRGLRQSLSSLELLTCHARRSRHPCGPPSGRSASASFRKAS